MFDWVSRAEIQWWCRYRTVDERGKGLILLVCKFYDGSRLVKDQKSRPLFPFHLPSLTDLLDLIYRPQVSLSSSAGSPVYLSSS